MGITGGGKDMQLGCVGWILPSRVLDISGGRHLTIGYLLKNKREDLGFKFLVGWLR